MKKLLTNKIFLSTILVILMGLSSYIGGKIGDTVYIEVNNTPEVDTVFIKDVVHTIDTVEILKFIDTSKVDSFYRSTIGEISFGDSTNKFVNLGVRVEYPSGDREITYINKYKLRNFRTYAGIGLLDNGLSISYDVYYKKLGIGTVISYNNKKGIFLKYNF